MKRIAQTLGKWSFELAEQPMFLLNPATGVIEAANRAACRSLGRDPAALSGVCFFDLLATGREPFALPEEPPDAPEQDAPRKLGESPKTTLRHSDGSAVNWSIEAWLTQEAGARAILVLLSAPAAADPALSRAWSEAQASCYQYFVESIGEGFLALDEEGVIVFANHAAEVLLARPRQFLVGQLLPVVFPGLDARALRDAVDPERVSGRQHNTLIVPGRLSHDPRLFELSINRQAGGSGVLFRDINERVKHEMEIARLNATMAASQQLLRHKNDELNDSLEQLARMNDQLAQADRLKSEFLANTSHELRTPLNSIIGFLQLICEGLCESPEEEKEYIQNALASAQHLLSLINDVLDIAKIEAGKMTLLIDDLDLTRLFQEVYSLTHVQAQQKGLKLTCDPGQGVTVRADFHKTKQVLINLVGNSIKFTDRGSVRVGAAPDPLRPDLVRITVEDTGIGVPLDQQQAVFEKFIQVDGTSTRKYQGTGLGLAITRNLVEMMGGEISLESEGEGSGTRVHFTLPYGSQRGHGMGHDNEGVEPALPASF